MLNEKWNPNAKENSAVLRQSPRLKGQISSEGGNICIRENNSIYKNDHFRLKNYDFYTNR